ncbi:single-stranded DNA-binding protein [Aureibacillus halotolerans]|uniref:Single-stranded DNA-binding protein n=1 Tax=Aureibacillus halotolerans TaxID=1508390 RepID=A0A4V3D521_9BACI|nr:single-stranded DNA-binding protein [Aureibacillus halotolerans]TDQ38357.1 single-strand binding protein [Aureibacillus halotolerans]
MLNRVVLVGRLTRDPELRYTPNGQAVANFTLAVDRPFTNQQGTREADFLNCVVWRRQAENVANFLKKGSLAGVDGRIQSRSYDNQEGRRVYITEVVAESVQFLEPKSAKTGGENQGQGNQYGGGYGDDPYASSAPPQNQGSSYGGGNNQGRSNQNQRQDDPFADEGQPIDISDDDLPF